LKIVRKQSRRGRRELFSLKISMMEAMMEASKDQAVYQAAPFPNQISKDFFVPIQRIVQTSAGASGSC